MERILDWRVDTGKVREGQAVGSGLLRSRW